MGNSIKYKASAPAFVAAAMMMLCGIFQTAAYSQDATQSRPEEVVQTVNNPEAPTQNTADQGKSSSTAIPPTTLINNHTGAYVYKRPQGTANKGPNPAEDVQVQGTASRSATNSGTITYGPLDTSGIIH